jgi:hypothetical protein
MTSSSGSFPPRARNPVPLDEADPRLTGTILLKAHEVPRKHVPAYDPTVAVLTSVIERAITMATTLSPSHTNPEFYHEQKDELVSLLKAMRGARPQPGNEAVRQAIREAQKKMRANGWKSAAEAATERRLRLNGRTARNG